MSEEEISKQNEENTSGKKPNIMRRLYDWMLSWADKPRSMMALSAFSFAESSFFPIPPDVLLIPMTFGAPKKWFKIAAVCTVASVLGGILGWWIGYAVWNAVSDFFFNYIPGFTRETFEIVEKKYNDNAFFAIFGAALTPIPYKIFTIAAGVCKVDIITLVLASIFGRGARFFAVALVIRVMGPVAKPLIDKYFNLIATAFFILLVAGFVLIKHVI